MSEHPKCKHCDLPQSIQGRQLGLCPFHFAGEMVQQPGQVPDAVLATWVKYLAAFYIHRWKQPQP